MKREKEKKKKLNSSLNLIEQETLSDYLDKAVVSGLKNEK